MKKSIFSYLVSYVPTDKRESKEDYLTQMFAWILENIEGIATTYIQELCKKGNIVIEDNSGFDVEVLTQTVVPNGRIDLLLRVNKKVAFICEHKVHSELSENQIKKYMDDSKLLGPEKFYSVLVTFSTLQHTQMADVSIVWSDIYEMVDEVIHDYDGEEAFILSQFMKYLAENGMGKAELIQPEAMLGYWPAVNLEYKLDRIFRQIETADYQKLCPGLEELGDGYDPSYTRSRWGRLGIDFFTSWNKMGLFAGVLMHTTDHHLWPYDVEKGPDLVIFLESDYSKTDAQKRVNYENNIHSEKYRKMISKLAEDSGTFDFLPGISESPWRIAVLRKPLYDVLIGKYKQSEQVDAILEAIIEAINMFIGAMK